MRAISTSAAAAPGQLPPASAIPALAPQRAPADASSMPGAIRIERLILHGLNNRAEALQLVDEAAILTDESERYFALHVQSAAERADWRARFTDPEGDVPALCRALLGSAEEFVAASRELALRLYEQMRPRTIAPGDFVAAIYTSGAARRHIALLKLDPDERLARTFTSSGGRTRVSIAAARNLLPDSRNLQKCALFSPADAAAPFPVILLDNQAGPRTEGVAAFFYRGFLTAELEPSPRRRTREFLRCCDTWFASYRDALPPASVAAFYETRRAHLRAGELDCRQFAVAALPGYPALALELEARLATILGSTESSDAAAKTPPFLVDSAIAAPVLSRITLELDGGARLIVPAERFAELVHIEPERTAENKVRIIIESLTLKEGSDR